MTTTETQPATPPGYDAETFQNWLESDCGPRPVVGSCWRDSSDIHAEPGCCPRCGGEAVDVSCGESGLLLCDDCGLEFYGLDSWLPARLGGI